MDMFPLIMIGCGALVVLLMVVFAFAGPSAERAGTRRLSALRERHSTSANAAVEAQLRRITTNRATRMDLAAGRFLPNVEQLKKRLAMTGKTWTVGQYGMATLGIALVIGLLLTVKGAPLLLALFAGLFIGAAIPHKVVGFFIKRRIKKFNAKFPDAIELLVRGLRSGLPISETMAVVAAEVPGPVGEEFRNVSDKMKIGRSMDAALQDTADRLGTPEFQFFVITINIQRETGGNLAETLANLANVLRQRGQMKLKIKAMSSESKASAYIVGSLPFIVFTMIWFINGSYMQTFFVITINIQRETGGNLAETLANLANVLRQRGQMKLKIKAMSSESKASAYIVGSLPFIVFTMIWFINGSYMQTFFVDPRLMIAGGGGLVWMSIGGFIMAKMVNFEI